MAVAKGKFLVLTAHGNVLGIVAVEDATWKEIEQLQIFVQNYSHGTAQLHAVDHEAVRSVKHAVRAEIVLEMRFLEPLLASVDPHSQG